MAALGLGTEYNLYLLSWVQNIFSSCTRAVDRIYFVDNRDGDQIYSVAIRARDRIYSVAIVAGTDFIL